MAFSTNCTNKGCGKQMQPYISKDDDKVYCSLCEQEITTLTIFAKNQMKAAKQYREKSKTSFVVKCSFCNKEDRPQVLNDDVVCSKCLKPLSNITKIFKDMLKVQLLKKEI